MGDQNHRNQDQKEPIAVVGSACRFPGSLDTPSKLWRFLSNPKDLLSKIPSERFNADAYYHPNGQHHGTSNVTESYLLREDIRHFDAGFFNIKPIEAHSIDPQQRLLLEVVYESLEAGGLSIESLAGSETGVYVGLMCADYHLHLQRDVDALPIYTGTGTARSIISNRISYFFDWHGPSMTIDTACSSSLVAIHQAVQLLRSGESNLAVAAGSNLILGPENYIGESKLQMLSPGSRSRMWDVDADGYARGEGVASVVLKRLSDAIRDGDHIECIVRETGVNSDGRTKGITMPNQLAQADLITRTYNKAGLDPRNPDERCQYFEAHGTGTNAGDSREAEGITRAFFGLESPASTQNDPLYVGSIKTVIGHTEGTAGLAGFLKASFAVQSGVIPPNMLFNTLSADVAPHYGKLQIVTAAKLWPTVSGARRASVNSFGFGGTNSHVIVENMESPINKHTSTSTKPFTPFVFSAATETALESIIAAYSTHLEINPKIDIGDLSYTLHSRRSAFGVRTSFSASSARQLYSKLKEHLAQVQDGSSENVQNAGIRPTSDPPRVLGIFTGQGAQWATMGKKLILGSDYCKEYLATLQTTLDNLPKEHRPSWLLAEELAAPALESRIGEAAVSQTLCTAVQVILVDLLRAAGIEFKAVVGHSSGEIGAAYAATLISRDEAIKIAYYRGLYTTSAAYEKKGGMIAVGTSFEDATTVCGLEAFEGRIAVAANNSPSSVTLSGDDDAIDEVQALFEDEKKFARRLKVDKAYHSHHMVPCSAPYVEALRSCNIKPRDSNNSCAWYSSVYEDTKMTAMDSLRGEYWRDNMLKPVAFAQALQAATANEDPFNLVVEVGPHPALQGPATETLQAIYGKSLAYTGVLRRNSDDVETFSAALGFIWSQFSSPPVNFNQYDNLVTNNSHRQLLTGLPTYKWDHDRIYWHETRLSRAFNMRKEGPNPLLGTRLADGLDDEIRWRNLIRPSELDWIDGHRLQGQMVFPAAAYVSSAVESAGFLVTGQPISAIEIRDFTIGRALTFQDSQTGVESLFVLSNIDRIRLDQVVASFKFHAATTQDADSLSCLATGKLIVTIAKEPPFSTSPREAVEPPNAIDVSEDKFYLSLDKLGYQYSGDFRGLKSIRRKLDYGSALINVPQQGAADAVLIHPALLDTAFQAIFLAHGCPGDGSLNQLHVPTRIANMKFDISGCEQDLVPGATLALESHLTENPFKTDIIGGDVDVFRADHQTTLIQVQGVRVTPFAQRTEASDTSVFSENLWAPLFPDGTIAANTRATAEDYELGMALERVSIYFIKKINEEIPIEQRDHLQWHHEAMFDFVSLILNDVQNDRQRFAHKEWLNDTWDDISQVIAPYSDEISMRLVRTVGENLAAAVRGETQILQHMMEDNILNRYYVEGLGIKDGSDFIARTVAQVVHRYPHMDILEIGAGTGGATKAIMRTIGRSFGSYTFTDISTGFFETAQEVFANEVDKMIFKALDIGRDVAEQGYAEHSYDLLIGSIVLHATENLERTLQNARRLLKPGGYLIILELTCQDVLHIRYAMSGLPGWWLGRDDGRKLTPCVSSGEWHSIMKKTGFSGIDTLTPEIDELPRPFSIIVTQAIDDRVNLLREPVRHHRPSMMNDVEVVIIGGSTLSTVVLIDQFLDLTQHLNMSVTRFRSLDELESANISPTALVLGVTELDRPLFQDLTESRLAGLQSLVDYQRTILWVTQGGRMEQPYMSMTVGLARSIAFETPDVRLQILDLDYSRKPDAKLVADTLLRLHLTPETEGMLWSTEQELAQEGDRVMIPRLIPAKAANNRFNASSREITEERNVSQSWLTLDRSEDGYNMYETNSPRNSDNTYVRVTKATLAPIMGQYYGIVGEDSGTGKPVLGFSTINGSRVQKTHPDHFAPYDVSKEARTEKIVAALQPNAVALINDIPRDLAKRVRERAHEKNTTVFYVSCESDSGPVGVDWIRFNTLPSNVSTFLDCSESTGDSGAILLSCLPKNCSYGISEEKHLASILSRVLLDDFASHTIENLPTTSARDVTKRALSISDATLVNWEAEDKITFYPDKTYALFGLTSDLATSLVDWIRTPKVDGRWLEQMREAGVHVHVFSNDITSQTAVQELVARIRRDMPPVAGIMHGAMVLEDAAFSDMSLETMMKVIRPKVLGTQYLDRLFQKDDLDFFIMYSSLASAVGNRGQSNYSAANMFMTATASDRRHRGLAASVLHLSAVVGVGYIMRELDDFVLGAVHRAGFGVLSERTFHQCIAEAILAGRPQSGRNPEIVTGLRLLNADDDDPVPWMKNPRFQHCINFGSGTSLQRLSGNTQAPLKTQLSTATSLEEVRQIVQRAFANKLRVALQLSLEEESAWAKISTSNADDLGVDSLVAVEIRSWFLKELDVDIPVLQILGGISNEELVERTIEKLPMGLGLGIESTDGNNIDEIKPELQAQAASSVSSSPATENASSHLISEDIESISTAPSKEVVRKEYTPSSKSDTSSNDLKPVRRSILPEDIEKAVPISSGQSRFWFLSHFVDDPTTFNVTFSIKLQGPLKVDQFNAAILQIARRHEALRTAFVSQGDKIMQVILKNSILRVEKKAIQDASQVTREFESIRDHNYDIEHGETMRIVLLTLTPTDFFAVIGYHHINMDGASLEVFLSELEKAYMGKNLPLRPLQYPTFSEKQRLAIQNGEMNREIDYWRTEFTDSSPVLPLLPFSLNKTREAIQRYDHNEASRLINTKLATQIREMCRKQKANVFHFYLSIMELTLYRLLGIEDLCIGTADANRFEGNLAGSMGMYLNLLPLRFHIKDTQAFGDVLKETRRKAYGAMANSHLPFDVLLDKLQVSRSTLHSPLFQAFINYRAGVAEKRRFGAVHGTGENYSFGRTAYDITFDIFDNPGQDTRVAVILQKQLYSEEDAKIVLDSYFELLDYFSKNPLASLGTLAPVERGMGPEKSIELGLGPIRESAWPETVVHRIDDMGDSWSYAEMADRVNAIASTLAEHGVTPGSVVGVFQAPGLYWIASLVAIMRIGAVYVPLDLNSTASRLATMVNDCRPTAIIIDQTTSTEVAELGLQQKASIIDVASIPASVKNVLSITATSTDAAVIFYTSGTTGTPKGVVLSHQNLRNHLEFERISGQEIVLQHSALGFDLGLDQCLLALTLGGTLIVVPRSSRGDPMAIVKLISQESVTYTGATPSEYSSWIQYGFSTLASHTSWRYAMVCGEKCPPKLIDDFAKLNLPNLQLWNSYGPTEGTFGSTDIILSPGKPLPDPVLIGSAMTNRSVYILDDDFNPVSLGTTGQICIGGAGLAIGYLHNTALTNQKFITNPFAPDYFKAKGWTRMYSTGDKGRMMADGALEILGRVDGDSQIKLRGIRVELEDIESTILKSAKGALATVVVTARGDPPMLVAHAVFDSHVEAQDSFLQDLKASLPLPQYMRPAAIVAVPSLPLTANGKLDRKAIQDMPITKGDGAQRKAQLNNIELQGEIKKQMGVTLKVVQLFENSTLGAMAAVIQDATYADADQIDWVDETGLTKEMVDAGHNPRLSHARTGTVILTGATGFLGQELLRQLVASPEIQEIHCIAVRSASKLGDLASSPKVSVHAGDLATPNLGLTPKAAAAMFARADALVHSGADVSFLKTYTTLRGPNVEATKALALLALAHGTPVHYVSTIATGRLKAGSVFAEESLRAHAPPAGFPDAYVASKWAAEVFLENVHARLGLRVRVHRPSSITGVGASELDVVNAVVLFARRLRAVPVSSRWSGKLDFISVERTAREIVGEVLAVSDDDGDDGIAFRHHSGEVIIPIENLTEYLEKTDGATYVELPLLEWTEKAVGEGLNVLIAAYLSAVDELDMDLVFQDLVKGQRN
ncbi:putative polyketide synthase [Hypoxylon crocopeplum]|nr:putative polyketide synthase [Hypoxylon crocopeplum]